MVFFVYFQGDCANLEKFVPRRCRANPCGLTLRNVNKFTFFAITEASESLPTNPLGSTTKIPYILYGIFLFIFCLCSIDIWRFWGVDFVCGGKYNLDIRRWRYEKTFVENRKFDICAGTGAGNVCGMFGIGRRRRRGGRAQRRVQRGRKGQELHIRYR